MSAPAEKTIRQKLLEVLRGGFFTSKDLSRMVGVPEKEVLLHLPHLAKSHRSGFRVEPSRCLGCGFVFRKRDRLKTPGKCPLCKSEEITETRYGIEGE